MFAVMLKSVLIVSSFLPVLLALKLATGTISSKYRMTGGRDAVLGEFPYHVGIGYHSENISSFCGGSLISNEWVLSAVSCTGGANYLVVYLGNTEFKRGTSYCITPNYITNHKDYNPRTKENDISLIKIPFTPYSHSIKSVKLPRIDDRSSYADVSAVATGWSDDVPLSTCLQYAPFAVMSNENCKRFCQLIKETQLCVETTKSRSLTFGDIGGPLVYDSSRDGLIQIGIASFATHVSCDQGFPFGLTRVSKFLHWIRRKTGPNLEINVFTNNTEEISNEIQISKV